MQQTFQTFDELRHHVYHTKNFQLDIEKLSCTSSAIRLHIHRMLSLLARNFRSKPVPYRGKKTGHKINRVKLLVGGNFSHFHIKLVTFPQLNFRF